VDRAADSVFQDARAVKTKFSRRSRRSSTPWGRKTGRSFPTGEYTFGGNIRGNWLNANSTIVKITNSYGHSVISGASKMS